MPNHFQEAADRLAASLSNQDMNNPVKMKVVTGTSTNTAYQNLSTGPSSVKLTGNIGYVRAEDTKIRDPYEGYVRYDDQRRNARVVAYDDEFTNENSLVFGWLSGEWKDSEGKTWFIVRLNSDPLVTLPELNAMLIEKSLASRGESVKKNLDVGAFTHVKLMEQ
jgi:hypothetical protein